MRAVAFEMELWESPYPKIPLRAESARPCPVTFWMFPQHLWANCSRWHPEEASIFSSLYRISCILVCAHCLLSCHQASPSRVWLLLLYSTPWYLHIRTRFPELSHLWAEWNHRIMEFFWLEKTFKTIKSSSQQLLKWKMPIFVTYVALCWAHSRISMYPL